MNVRKYCRISAIVFSVVATAHFFRILNGWPMGIGDLSVPIIVSWFGLIGPGILAVWGHREARWNNSAGSAER
jgi:hypothetical protein